MRGRWHTGIVNPGSEIPRIIHQTWKDSDVPSKWRPWAESWRQHHQEWEYRLWSDAACREFIAEHYRWFLPIYDSYPETIMRVDAVRYFLLDHFGGLYVDLDFECLRPVTELLAGDDVVIGVEPSEHTKLFPARRRLDQVVGNAFIASPPRHRFWVHVHRELVASHKMREPLDVAGPIFLTRVVEDTACDGVRLVPSRLLYPVISSFATEVFGPQEPNLDAAYAVHHWSASWIFDAAWTPRPSAVVILPFRVSEAAQPLLDGQVDLDAQRRRWSAGVAPAVSCLMVTKDRPSLAARAIACFRAQTYPNVELVVVDDSTDDTLQRHIKSLGDRRIHHQWLPGDGRTLGELRNLAVEHAAASYVCQWDDDDLYDPERVERQLAALLAVRADACFLERKRLWWPAQRQLALSGYRIWEKSLLCCKDKLPRYPALRKDEDTSVTTRLVQTGRIVSLDSPDIYTYIFYGDNTFEELRFAQHFEAATETWDRESYAEALLAMTARVPIKPADIPVTDPELRFRVADSRIDEPAVHSATIRPQLLILTPVKDGAPYLDRYLDNLFKLDYPAEEISLGLLEGDSTDDTSDRLLANLPELTKRLRRVTFISRDFGFPSPERWWDPAIQRRRRSAIAKARNHLLSRTLGEEEWVLWLDIDVTEYPRDLVQRLLGAGKDIVAAHCVTTPAGPTFDLNTFILEGNASRRNWSQWIRDGLLQPPKGFGRIYLDELRKHQLIRVDSVGGATLLVRADLHRDGLNFPPYPYQQLIETEAMAAMARAMGTACWAMPNLEVVRPLHV
jgi:glycosyltransferase involved in cell wall biosynthesis